MCDRVGWDGHEEAFAVTDAIYLTWRVPVVIVAMFQHRSGTVCLRERRFTQTHLSHSELCLRHPSLDTCTVPRGLLCHIAAHRSLGPPAPQFEQTYAISETAKWRRRLTDRDRRGKGFRKGAGFFGEEVCSPLAWRNGEEWLQHERLEKQEMKTK